HPDKLCDSVSDAIVGQYVRQDREAVVSAECAVSNGVLFVAVRFGSSAVVDVPHVARHTVSEIGYGGDEDFDPRSATVLTSFSEIASPDAADKSRLAVTDQVTVFGYACNHTDCLMPLPIYLAHKLARRMSRLRKDATLSYLAPEGKTQVGVEFVDRRPRHIYSVNLIASQKRADEPELETLRQDLREAVIEPVFAEETIRIDGRTRVDINLGGALVKGGPAVHSGLTGRKTHVDTYGEYARASGMALSGKDPSRIGRIGVYGARWVARHVVARGLAEECEVSISYALGSPGPISVQAETFGTGTKPDAELVRAIGSSFDLRLGSLLARFRLRELPLEHADGFFPKLAAFGHVGRTDIELPWEVLDPSIELG
ncbi:MAG TPA: methionine adenosyltransferase, partial [Vicinamibacteria bacterium]